MEPGLPSEDRLMECLHCKGEMERGTAPFCVDRHGYHVPRSSRSSAPWRRSTVRTSGSPPPFEGRDSWERTWDVAP